MSLFRPNKGGDRYGAIIDIGSGSVLVSIIHSSATATYPNIVWSHREHAPLRNIDSVDQSAKSVMTALINASILLDSEGRKRLRAYKRDAKIQEIQCTIAAPWSYTVTKTISYTQKEAFEITSDLIEELIDTIEKQIASDLKQNESLQNLGLDIITRQTMNLSVNGYIIENPEGRHANSITVSQASAVTQRYLIDTISELQHKLFSRLDIRKISFIMVLYTVTKNLMNKPRDICLVDITYEATEIGIVRNGILTYCTHTPFGSFSLAREISEITKVPLHEAFANLHTEVPYSFLESLTEERRKEVGIVFSNYVEKVADLFRETGDELIIPKHISLHADLYSESMFMDLIGKAAKIGSKSEPQITPISKEIVKRLYPIVKGQGLSSKLPTDTALLLSAQFFHTRVKHNDFEYI